MNFIAITNTQILRMLASAALGLALLANVPFVTDAKQSPRRQRKPNIILILADDLAV